MTVPEYIYSEGRKKGCTKEALCALLAQIQEESGFSPTNLEDTANTKLGMTDQQYTQAVDNGTYSNFVMDGFGYGLPQFTFYTRKRQFLNWMKARGLSIGNLEGQVEFIWYELKSDFNAIWQKMLTSNSLYDLTKELLYKWENPKEKEENLKRRYKYAQEWLSYFSNESSTNSGVVQQPQEGWEKIPATDYWPPRTICEGMDGKDVVLLRSILYARGWVDYVDDDYFDKGLTAVVKHFQEAYGLDVDGIVGPQTWAALFNTK